MESRGNCAPGTLILITFYIIIIAHTSIAINLQMIVLALYGSTGVVDIGSRGHAADNSIETTAECYFRAYAAHAHD